MKTFPILFFLLFFASISVNAQRKSDLIAEIQTLKSEKDSLRSVIRDAQKNVSVSEARATSFEAQVAELQEANRNLMSNMSNFTTVSTKNSEIATSAMETLQAREQQLKFIKDAIASNDSTIIVVLTNVKQTLGEDTKINVSNGAVVISSGLEKLYGSDTGTELVPEAEAWAEKIADVLKANPTTAVDIEGLSMTGDLDLPAKQALALSTTLQNKFAIAPERITAVGKDGNFKEGVQLKIHPQFQDFYLMVREEMKN